MSKSLPRPLITEKRQKATDRKRRLAMLSRWLHIYLSMVGFALVFFFAVTGLTLNHADKFADEVHSSQDKGRLDPKWVNMPDTAKLDKLLIVEYLRNKHGIKAAMSDFRIDDSQVSVSFKGPGYAADVFINRGTGEYDVSRTTAGFVGIINDLHKGRDAGPVWSVLIDVAAVLMTLISLTGMILLFFIKRRRLSGIITALFGLLIAYLVYKIWIR